MAEKNKKVFVAMSGGVDSSVAALLLKQRNYDVTGVYMKNWSDPLAHDCPWREDIKYFKQTCRQLGIKGRIEVFEEEYKKKVVDYLIKGYKKGITPNPDMLCNSEIKFKVFLDKAKALGADFIATGHHVKKMSYQGRPSLYIAKDPDKDQSYFLSLLSQKQIKNSLFPVGHYFKDEIRQIAKKNKLTVHGRKDSQGICFIGKVKFSDFIREFIPPKPGDIIDKKGKVIGRHDGVFYYTIGQRHGLRVGGGTPYFITSKNVKKNHLLVAKADDQKELMSKKINVSNFNWIDDRDKKMIKTCQARIRYRQSLQNCRVRSNGTMLVLDFKRKQRAATPGQFAVLYSGKRMLGGGVIN